MIQKSTLRRSERGNVFFTLFGAVAVVGVLGAGIMATMRGPLSTMVEVNRRTQAEAEMSLAAKLVLLEAVESLANGGDCDSDDFVEPLEYKDAGAGDKPTGGGYLPDSIGSNKEDPWGIMYGYCAWDAGPTIDAAACDDDTSSSFERLDGEGNADEDYTVIAIISAGPDRIFNTTCTGGASPDVTKTAGSDDIINSFDYQAATAATGGLWSIKSGDPDTAEIDKDIEALGATFTEEVDLSTSATAQLKLGAASMLLPTQVELPTCNAANESLIRINTAGDPDAMEICNEDDGAPGTFAWESVAAGVAASSLWKNDGPGGPNEIYYNTDNVGIGLNDPTEALDVTGNVQLSGDAMLSNTQSVVWASGASVTEASGALEVNANGGAGVELDVDADAVTISADTVMTGTTSTNAADALTVEANDGTDILIVQNDGNVGIGDASPNDALDVSGNIGVTGNIELTTNDSIIEWGGTGGVHITGNELANTIIVDADTTIQGSTSDNTADALVVEDLGGTDILVVQNDGKVGIGVSNPNDELDVGGNIDATGTINATGNITSGADITATGDVTGTDIIATDEVYVLTDKKLGPPNECDADEKLDWDDSSGWACITDLNDGSGGDGSTDLDKIDPALADNSITNAAWNQVWNWQLTAAETGFIFGESGASTGGSNDQHILSAQTLASSTAMPLYLLNLGAGRTLQIDDEAGDTTPFIIDATGDVAIGAVPGNGKFTVNQTNSSEIVANFNSSSGPALQIDRFGRLYGWGGLDIKYTTGSQALLAFGNSPGLLVQPRLASHVVFTARAGGGQTANIQNWESSTPTVLSFVDKDGYFGINTTTISTGGEQDLELDVEGDIGATNYCDAAGNNCFVASDVGSGGTPELSDIIAATADNTIASAAWNQVWNWQLTGAEAAFTFGESAASTGGANNQAILQLSTLASSTASPLFVNNLGDGLSLVVNDAAADTTPFVIDAAGDVGIGTSSPDNKLHIQIPDAGAASAATVLKLGRSTYSSIGDTDYLDFGEPGSFHSRISSAIAGTGPITSDLAFWTSGTQRMIIDNGGSVGIGTATVSTGGEQDLELDVEGDIGAVNYCDEDGDNCFVAGDVGGLWTDNTTHITRENAHILDAGETMTTAGFDGGPGNAMIWHPDKAAFRAGSATGTEWDEASLGTGSIALGLNNTASGIANVALGTGNTAGGVGSGQGQIALGFASSTSGTSRGNTAIGFSAQATASTANNPSIAIGSLVTASAPYSLALGTEATASGPRSMALGLGTAAVDPIVSGAGSLGIFMGSQNSVDITTANTMAILGGKVVIDAAQAATELAASTGGEQDLELDVEGDIGAINYCDEDGNNCFAATDVGAPGGSVLSSISAATADNTIASAAWNQTWNWQLTGAETAFTFGESTASTGGSNDQYILAAKTLATSTAMPMFIQNLGAGRSFQVNDEAIEATPFVIDADGNVGIGTATPTQKLLVNGGGAGANVMVSGTASGVMLEDNNATADEKIAQLLNASSKIRLRGLSDVYAETVTGITLDLNSGDVGIGTTSPDNRLHIQVPDAGPSSPETLLKLGRDIYSLAGGDIDYIDFGAPGTFHSRISSEITGTGPTTSDLAFWTSGTQRMIIDDGGSVGIGTATVSTGGEQDLELDVEGDIGAVNYCDEDGDNCFVASDVGSGSDDDWQIDVGNSYVYNTTDNIGIGTNTPLDQLHIHANTGSHGARITNNAINLSAGNALWFAMDADGTPDWAGIGQYWTGALRLSGGNSLATPDMTIANDGNVGIGTTFPGSPLHILQSGTPVTPLAGTGFVLQNTANASDAAWATIFSGNTATGQLNFGDTDDEFQGRIMYDHNADALRIYSNGNENMRIDSAGNVGIGTATPGSKLDVNGVVRIDDDIILDDNDGAQYIVVQNDTDSFRIAEAGGTDFADAQLLARNIYMSGDVGIGTATPSTGGEQDLELDVEGDIGAVNYCDEDGNNCFAASDVGSGSVTELDDLTDASTDYVTLDNMFLGLNAGNTTLGLYNLALGEAALTSLDATCAAAGDCDRNLAIGRNAGTATTLGTQNIFIGPNAGDGNTIGDQNIFMGYLAGDQNIDSHRNVGIGVQALRFAQRSTAGYANNVAVGGWALQGVSGVQDGIQNTAVGSLAGRYVSSGDNNTSLGYNALLGDTAGVTGGNNLALGAQTGVSLTSGSQNIFVGSGTGGTLVDGDNNILLGYNIEPPATNTSNYLSIGDLIYGNLSSGFVGIGQSTPTLKLDILTDTDASTEGVQIKSPNNSWVRIHPDAGAGNYTGLAQAGDTTMIFSDNVQNTGRFVLAPWNNTNAGMVMDGAGNIGIGAATPGAKLQVNSTNLQSTPAIGTRGTTDAFEWGHANQAGYGSTLGHMSSSGQAFLAFNAEHGTNANTFRTRGIQGRILMSGNNGSLLIGRAATASADNQTFTEDMRISPGGAVLINTTTASVGSQTLELDVEGDIGAVNYCDEDGNNCFVAGDVGGAIALDDLTDVSTDYVTLDNMFLGSGAGNTTLGLYNLALGEGALTSLDATCAVANTCDHNIAIGRVAGSLTTTGYQNSFVGSAAGYRNTTGYQNIFVGYASGYDNTVSTRNTAIGALAMRYADRSTAGGGHNTAIGFYSLFGVNGVDDGLQNTAVGAFSGRYISSGDYNTAIGYNALDGAATGITGTANTALGANTGSDLTSGANNVFVGYGTGSTLVNGSTNILIGYDIETPATNTSSHLNIGNTIYGNLATDNVGIGIATPSGAHSLHAFGNILAQTTASSTGTARNSGIHFYTDKAFGTELHYGSGAQSAGWATAIYGRSTDTVALRLGAYASNATAQNTFSEYMTITNTGNVGIGDTTPSTALEVSGTARATLFESDTSVVANAFDLAERYASDQDIAPGTIVVLDKEKPLYVEEAAADNKGTVLGIVSTNPGLVLGLEENEVFDDAPHVSLIAMSGRVPLKVTGENGAIKIGDRVALSPTIDGFGTKAGENTSTIVGIALEKFESDDIDSVGTIEVFVKTKDQVVENELRSELAALRTTNEEILTAMSELAADVKGLKAHTGYGSVIKAGFGIGLLGALIGFFGFYFCVPGNRKRSYK